MYNWILSHKSFQQKAKFQRKLKTVTVKKYVEQNSPDQEFELEQIHQCKYDSQGGVKFC